MFALLDACDISRNTAVGTNGRRSLQALYSAIPCLAIPMNAATTIQNSFEMGRGYDFYFSDGQDLKVGDKLSWSGDTYVVSAVQRYSVPVVAHVHAMVKQEVN